MAGTLAALYNRCVDALSFGSDYQKLRRLLNARIDSPVSSMEMPPSHPAGYVRELKKRRISIVESYLVIIRSLESEHHHERIDALRMLGEQTSHAKNLTMPLNTARVQIALMKEAIKSRDNRRRQLECLYDFTVSSYGQPSVIRARLDELGIIEVPETGQRLADMDLGWDRHVHDNSSYGRKTPSQLVIDAFIKGISGITVAFNQLDTLGNGEEVLAAGEILGVRVEIGVEFSVSTRGHRFHFMYLLPAVRTSAELEEFFGRHGEGLRPFLDGLALNQESRIASIHALIENFNAVHLPALNSGWEPGSDFALPALDIAAIDEIVPIESLNRMHLGELLYAQWKPVLLRRVLLAKSKLSFAREELTRGRISRWDFSNIETRYQALRKAYTELNPEDLRAQYFETPQLSEYPTVFTDMEAVCRPLKATGGSIKMLHPLEHGLDAAYEVMFADAAWIDQVEVYNVYDSINRSVDETLRFARFVNVLNSGTPALVRPFLEGHDLNGADADLEGTLVVIRERPLVPVCGSDSTGRSSTIPGMGFILASRVLGPRRRGYLARHFTLPEFVARIVAARGAHVTPEAETGPHDDIISMGKSTQFIPNRVGDETEVTPIPPDRAVRYLNPTLRNLLFTGVGFVLAWLTIGWQYALVWFGITGLRHVIVDLIARRGAQLREWSLRAIDWRNIARSLFWTGLSVPLLAFVKYEFDLLWPLEPSGTFYQFSRFFFISLVNSLYLMMHNILRGFPRGVTLSNLFRAFISWPFASLFGPLGDMLLIPTIVQSKFWSDAVGGVIEGSGKFLGAVALSRRDLSEIIPLACSEDETVRSTAILDLLYLFGRETRARTSLREIFFGRRNLYERIGDLMKRRKERPRPCQQEYRQLCAWFDHESNYHKLADFAVRKYPQEWTVMLIDLLARHYQDFREWLSGEKPVSGRRSKAAAARPVE
jgi:hypothetical protein